MWCLQETKMGVINGAVIYSLWGNQSVDWDFVQVEGASGGILVF